MAEETEAFLEIFIDGNDIHFIVNGHKNVGDDEISYEIAQYSLHIAELIVCVSNPARD